MDPLPRIVTVMEGEASSKVNSLMVLSTGKVYGKQCAESVCQRSQQAQCLLIDKHVRYRL